jgi:colanic acid/amylovoran biosynthesis glycosyltransferase
METGPSRRRVPICIVVPYVPAVTETFLRMHIEELPANVVVVHGWRPAIGDRPVLSFPARVMHKLWRMASGTGPKRETTAAYLKVFHRHKVAAVLAEFGDTGVQCMEACRLARVPLIVHFHGYDASNASILKEHAQTYPKLFQTAAALVVVSRAMERKLISLGAPSERVHYNACGVDLENFAGAQPERSEPLLIAVGRFTEKKAPQVTLRAFARAHRECPQARLVMIGEGPLLNTCRDLARRLAIEESVTFLGAQPHPVVEGALRSARCLVQHSVVAPSGDSEGTPLSIMEAGSAGLPTVATRHGGIPEAVIDGETGFLVDEGDADGMAEFMVRMIKEPDLAGRMGRAARAHIRQHFSKERSIAGLWGIIDACIRERSKSAPPIRV